MSDRSFVNKWHEFREKACLWVKHAIHFTNFYVYLNIFRHTSMDDAIHFTNFYVYLNISVIQATFVVYLERCTGFLGRLKPMCIFRYVDSLYRLSRAFKIDSSI